MTNPTTRPPGAVGDEQRLLKLVYEAIQIAVPVLEPVKETNAVARIFRVADEITAYYVDAGLPSGAEGEAPNPDPVAEQERPDPERVVVRLWPDQRSYFLNECTDEEMGRWLRRALSQEPQRCPNPNCKRVEAERFEALRLLREIRDYADWRAPYETRGEIDRFLERYV